MPRSSIRPAPGHAVSLKATAISTNEEEGHFAPLFLIYKHDADEDPLIYHGPGLFETEAAAAKVSVDLLATALAQLNMLLTSTGFTQTRTDAQDEPKEYP